jgi:hypothetical protein
MTLTPKEPQKAIGQEARQTYLVFARGVIGDMAMDYTSLYQQFAVNDWAAMKLDDEVTTAALKAGYAPKDIIGFLHQGPYIQHHLHGRKVPVKTLTHYAKSTVMMAIEQMKEGRSSQSSFHQGRYRQSQRELES